MKPNAKKHLRTASAVTFSAFLTAVNINTFVDTAGLYPGGVSGLSILIQRTVSDAFHFSPSFSFIYLILNVIPVYIGFRYIGKNITLYSCLMIVLNGEFTDLLPSYQITEDILLISVFGGMMQGAAIALCLNAGATSGGSDFITIFLSERRGIDSFSFMLCFDAVILCAAGFLFGWDKALYSIIFQYASTAVIRVLYKKYQQSTLFIVTIKPRTVCNAISSISRHSATVLEGTGSYGHQNKSIVYSVVSAAESAKVIRNIRQIDPEVFINEIKTQKLSGRFYQPKES